MPGQHKVEPKNLAPVVSGMLLHFCLFVHALNISSNVYIIITSDKGEGAFARVHLSVCLSVSL